MAESRLPKEINFQRFLRIFKDNYSSNSDSQFCFILGAGASVASGIKDGGNSSQ